MRKKTVLIILSILLFLCLGGLVYWYLAIYRYSSSPSDYEYLQNFLKNDSKKEKSYIVTGTIYNINTDDETIFFDFNAWDLNNYDSLYIEDLSLPYSKYIGAENPLDQELIPIVFEINFTAEEPSSLFKKQTYILDNWNVQVLELDKEELETELKQTYDYLSKYTIITSPENIDAMLYKDLTLSFYKKYGKEYFENSLLDKLDLPMTGLTTEVSEEQFPKDVTDNTYSFIPRRCNVLISIDKVSPNYFDDLGDGCTKKELEKLAVNKINSNKSYLNGLIDLVTLINIQNLENDFSTKQESSTYDQIFNLIDLEKDLETTNSPLQEELKNSIAARVFQSDILDYKTYCAFSTLLDEKDNQSFFDNSALLLNEENIKRFYQIGDQHPKDSLLCTESFLNTSNSHLKQWAKSNLYKNYFLEYIQDPETYVLNQPEKSYILIKLLLHENEK